MWPIRAFHERYLTPCPHRYHRVFLQTGTLLLTGWDIPAAGLLHAHSRKSACRQDRRNSSTCASNTRLRWRPFRSLRCTH